MQGGGVQKRQRKFRRRIKDDLNDIFDVVSCRDGNQSEAEIMDNEEVQAEIEEEVCFDNPLADSLRECFYKNRITTKGQNEIIAVIRNHFTEAELLLPKSSAGLMKTVRNTAQLISSVTNGQMFHIGIMKGLLTVLDDDYLQGRETIELDFGCDGVSPFDSSKLELWPLLGRVARTKDYHGGPPFIVSLFCGTSNKKPDPDEFLKEFVKEAATLMSDGVEIEGRKYSVRILKIIADQPARALIKCHNGHARSLVQCERCEVVGRSRGNITIFPPNACRNAPMRTDKSFREQRQPEYHTGNSPLLPLNIDMIHAFPLDPMHVLYQGVIKRWIDYMIDKKRSVNQLMVRRIVLESSYFMEEHLKKYFPTCFARRVRGLDERSLWKATEWRRFTLYDAIVILKKYGKKRAYRNFLLLFCAIRILSSKELVSSNDMLNDAEILLKTFVNDVAETMGRDFVCIKPHCLTHLVDDCRRHGVLENFSAFPFESYMSKLNKLIRAKRKCMEQIVRRLSEESLIREKNPAAFKKIAKVGKSQIKLLHKHSEGPLPPGIHGKQYTCAILNDLEIRLTEGDSFFRTTMGDLIRVLNIVETDEGNVILVGKKFTKETDFFHYPMMSSKLGIYKVGRMEEEFKIWRTGDLKIKCVLLPLDNEEETFVSFPLLHGGDEDAQTDDIID